MVLVEGPADDADKGSSSPELDASVEQSKSEDVSTSSASASKHAPDAANANESPDASDASLDATDATDTSDAAPAVPEAASDASQEGQSLNESHIQTVATADGLDLERMSDTVEDLSVYGTQQQRQSDVPLPEIPASLMSDQPLLPTDAWSSESSQRVRNWLLLGSAATVGILVAVGAFALVAMRLDKNNDVVVEAPAQDSQGDANDSHPEVVDPPPNGTPTTNENDNSRPTNPGSEGPGTGTSEANPPEESTSPITPPVDGASGEDPPTDDDDQPPDFLDGEIKADDPPDFVARVDTAASDDATLDKTLRNLEGLLDDGPAGELPVVPPMADIEPTEAGPARPARRVVNTAERLADTIEEIKFDDTPLNDFLRFVADFSTIPITLDADALQWLDATPHTPVSAHQKSATVQDLVQSVVESVGLTTQVVDDQLLVTLPEHGIHEVLYAIKDLTESNAERQALARLLADLVARDSWQSTAGLGSIVVSDEGLTIRQSTANHRQVLRFLEKLRIARGLSPVSSFAATNFDLASRFARVRTQLEKEISINFFHPTRLDQVTEILSKISKCRILIDWHSLHQEGWNSDTMVTMTVSDTPLDKALNELLEPMGLGYRCVDTDLLQITSSERLKRESQLEIYPVGDLIARRVTAVEIMAAVREAVGAELFSERGGPGSLAFDQRSGALLATFPQESQIVLEQALAELRAKTPK
jgi:hypothetical protein